jgi:hypothetical protein
MIVIIICFDQLKGRQWQNNLLSPNTHFQCCLISSNRGDSTTLSFELSTFDNDYPASELVLSDPIRGCYLRVLSMSILSHEVLETFDCDVESLFGEDSIRPVQEVFVPQEKTVSANVHDDTLLHVK